MDTALKSVLEEMVGKQVQIWAGGGSFYNQGILVGFDEAWVRLDSAGEALFFPIYSVACIKPMKEA